MSEAATTYDPSPEADPFEVTSARAEMLARHAVYVQGGFSTPEVEADRARKDMSDGGGPIGWDRMGREVADAVQARLDALGNTTPDPVETGGIDMDRVRRFRDLRSRQAAGEAEAKAIKEEADVLEQRLVEDFSEAGIQNVNVDGQTIYLHRSTFAMRKADVDTPVLKAALRAAGLEALIGETISAQTLNAYVREVLDREVEDGEAAPQLPEELRDLLELGERYAVRIRASSSRAKRPTT